MGKKRAKAVSGEINMTPDQIEGIVTLAIDRYKATEKRMIQKNRFHNTELLLRHYNSLKAHYDNAIDNLQQVQDIVDFEYTDEDELYIKSIRRSKSRTLIMIAHINAAVEELEERLVVEGQPEKFMVIREVYFEGKTFAKMAEKLNCSEMTVRRWKNEMIEEISLLLFGIEGLKLDF